MKKTAPELAATAVVSDSAFAHSSVTNYGIVEAGTAPTTATTTAASTAACTTFSDAGLMMFA